VSTRKPRLDDDHREVLEILRDNPNGLAGIDIQRAARQWPVRPSIDSLTRRKLIRHDGYYQVAYRQYFLTDAGREAIS
jgi:hypothetical protein